MACDALMPYCGVHYLWFAFVCSFNEVPPPCSLRKNGVGSEGEVAQIRKARLTTGHPDALGCHQQEVQT